MIVVADTSPLKYLVILGAIDVLPRLFSEVHVPLVVMQEPATQTELSPLQAKSCGRCHAARSIRNCGRRRKGQPVPRIDSAMRSSRLGRKTVSRNSGRYQAM
jgi:hypothetical protein